MVTGYSVIAELELTPGAKRHAALAFALQLPVLEETEDVLEIIQFYEQHKLMPSGVFGTVLSSELGKVLRLIPLSNND